MLASERTGQRHRSNYVIDGGLIKTLWQAMTPRVERCRFASLCLVRRGVDTSRM